MQKPVRTVFFENLDALRAIACIAVFAYHFFSYISLANPGFADNIIVKHFFLNGYLGVNLFFVLSGFLITYLLLAEKEQTGRIHVRFFYMRRILRIWPLYLVALITGFFIYPLLTHTFSSADVKEHLPFYLLFVNNFDRIQTGFAGAGNDSIGILWSIAVEEQFYLFWPLLLYKINRKYLLHFFLILVAASLIFRCFYVADHARMYFHTISVMSDLVIGALLALGCFYRTKLYDLFTNLNLYTIVSIYILFAFILYFHNYWLQSGAFFRVGERIFLSLFFAFIIGEQCFSKYSLIKLGRFKWLSGIGVISYGLYCLHLYGITLVQKLNIVFGQKAPGTLLFLIEMLLCFGGCVLLCYISYHFFENKFLRLKKYFIPTSSR